MRSEGLLLLSALLALALLLSIRVCRESERVAVNSPRKFVKLVGPGLFLRWPWQGPYSYTRIQIGDRGRHIANGWGKLHGENVPIQAMGMLKVDQGFRVKDFVNQEIVVVPESAKGEGQGT